MGNSSFPGRGQEPNFPWRYLFKEVSAKTAAQKKRGGLCKFWGCSNLQRTPTKRDCNTCHARLTRINNPERYAFTQIRDSAAKRHIPFNLTFDEFLGFDRQTGYTTHRGREDDSLTIDRIDSSKPYETGNIRALTWLENCAKKVEGMTDPIEPIAKALCLAAGGEVWQKFQKQAGEILQQVEILQQQQSGGFNHQDDNCPF